MFLINWYFSKLNGDKIYKKRFPKVQAFPKGYWDLPNAPMDYGFTHEEIDYAWARRKPGQAVYLGSRQGIYYFISNYL